MWACPSVQGLRMRSPLVPMLSLDFEAVVVAISLLSLSSGPFGKPTWDTTSWSRMQPSYQPAAVPDDAPLPAMREQAAHIPLPTPPSNLKTSSFSFFREGGGVSVVPDSPGCRCRQPGALLPLHGARDAHFLLGLCSEICCRGTCSFTSGHLLPLLSV